VYVRVFALGLMLMMAMMIIAMVMMAIVIVSIMAIIVPEALGQVSWTRQC